LRKVYAGTAAGKPDATFWSDNWKDFSVGQMVALCEKDPVVKLLRRFSPREGRILDAGCGLGQNVIYMRGLGFDMEGVDFSAELISRAMAYDGSLPVKTADLKALPFPCGYFKAYYAGGVIEHFEEGPQAVLKEASRVLAGDGVLMITVPYLNMKRRIEDFFRPVRPGCDFYEYMFTQKEMRGILFKNNFKVFYSQPFSLMAGLYDFKAVKSVARPGRRYPAALKRFFAQEEAGAPPAKLLLAIARICFGHMAFFACRKS